MQSSAAARAASRAVAAVGADRHAGDAGGQPQLHSDAPHRQSQAGPGDPGDLRLGIDDDQLDMDADYAAMLLALDVLMPEGEAGAQPPTLPPQTSGAVPKRAPH